MIRTLALLTVSTLLFGITFATGQDTSDPLQAKSVWANEKNNKMVLTITERKDESFKALFGDREVNGKIDGPSIFWLSKDVRALGKSGVGGDNYGILKKDDLGFKIDFTWQNKPAGPKGFFTLRQVVNNNVATNVPITKNIPPNSKEIKNDKKKILLNKKEEVIHLGNGINLEMVLIPAGKFIMGSPKDEKGRFSDKETQHEVTISKPFYMGKYEITMEQYHSIEPFPKSDTILGKAEFEKKIKSKVAMYGFQITDSINSVMDANRFFNKLNDKTGVKFRLPTEAEWEYACRAGTKTRFHFGDELTEKDVFFKDGFYEDLPVGSFKPNAFGLYDMHGGVSELCSDNFQNDLGPNPVIDPKGNRELRDSGIGVMRGGSSPIRLDGYGKPNTNFFRSAHREPPISGGKIGIRLVVPFEFFSGEEEVKPKYSIGDDKFEMVLISAGKFIMGSPKDEEGRTDGDEETQHEVTLTKSFYMGKYEVTVEQWVAVMGKDPSKFQGKKIPITDVSWNDCQVFIKKLNTTTKGGYRLPTEAEWEYACRASTTTVYSFGDKITLKDTNMENIADSRNNPKPVAVGSYKPNMFGLYDMHGNVCEWVEDFHFGFSPNAVTDPRNIKAFKKDPNVTFRGGSWNDGNRKLRSANRNQNTQNSHFPFVGFRLAKDK